MGIVVIGGGGGGGGVGPQGPQGERGFGAFEWSTDRVGAQQYKVGEVVFYNGQHYICIADNDALVPTDTLGVYWNAYSLVGPQGPAGADGAPGPGADQSLNISDNVVFNSVTANTANLIDTYTHGLTAGINGGQITLSNNATFPDSSHGIIFGDGTSIKTANGLSFDQNLNTTDAVAFTGLALNANGCGGSAVSFGFDPQPYVTIQDGNCDGSPLGNPLVLTGSGITFPDGTTQNTAGGGSSYDQSLNTADSVTFSGVTTQTLQSGISGPVSVQSDLWIPSHGLTFADGKRQTAACPIYRDHEGTRTYESGDIVHYNGSLYRCASPGQYQNSAPPTMDGTWVVISGPEGPPGPISNPFDQDLNTQNAVQFSSVSFPDGTQMTTAAAPLPPVGQGSGGYTFLWNPNGSPGWTYSQEGSHGVTWGANGTKAVTVYDGLASLSIFPHGISFPDGTFQSSAGGGGGGGVGSVVEGTFLIGYDGGWGHSGMVSGSFAGVEFHRQASGGHGRLTIRSAQSEQAWMSFSPYEGIRFADGTYQTTAYTGGGGGGGGSGSSWPTTPVEVAGTLLSFADVGVGTSLNVLNASSNAGVRIHFHGIYFGDGTLQSTAMPTPWNEGVSSNNNVMLYAGYDGSGNPVWKKTNYGTFGAFFREDSGGAGPGVAFGHGETNTGVYNGGCVFISAAHGRIYIGGDTEIGAFNVKFPGEVTIANLPTSDPAVAGRLWNDAGTLKVSAGGP